VLTDLEGRVLLCNQQTADMHGFERAEEMTGLLSLDLVAQEDRPRAIENLYKTLEVGETRNIEYSLLRKDGSRFPVELSAAVILGRDGQPLGFTGVMQYHNRIFDIFQRLHRPEDYPGTGIGLAIAHKAMQRMGGRVWAESAPGAAGATFYLEIPR